MRALLVLLLCAAAHAQVALVRQDSAVAGLDAVRVRDMLLGRVANWPDGTPVVVVLVQDPACDECLGRIAGRDHARLLRGWKRLVYSGGGTMPVLVSSERDAYEVLARRPGAIVVVPREADDKRLRSVRLDG